MGLEQKMSLSSNNSEPSEEGFVTDSFSDKKRDEQEEKPVDLDEAVREFGIIDRNLTGSISNENLS